MGTVESETGHSSGRYLQPVVRPSLRIEHVHRWGGNPKDRWMWRGVLDGNTEVEDWNTRQNLIDMAERNGWNWYIIRHKKDGTEEIVARSNDSR
jgi:hypothetical protein